MKSLLATLTLLLAAAPFAAASDLQTDLMANEKAVWTAWGKKDVEATHKLLTEDAVEIVIPGAPMVGKEAIVSALKAHTCELRSFDFQKVAMRQWSADVVGLWYTVTQDTVCDGEKQPGKLAVSSVYVKRDGKWMQAAYHESPMQ